MRQLNPEQYANMMDHLAFEPEALAASIKSYRLQFPTVRNQVVEWSMKFPMFLDAFYHWVYHNRQVPTQQQFWQHYQAAGQLPNLSAPLLEALRARAFRAYPSLVRDLHFNFLLQGQLPLVKLWYNRKLDVEEGIDTLIQYHDQLYALNLYTLTPRGQLGREKKAHRHAAFGNVTYLELPIALNDCDRCGAFLLYGLKECNRVAGLIAYGRSACK